MWACNIERTLSQTLAIDKWSFILQIIHISDMLEIFAHLHFLCGKTQSYILLLLPLAEVSLSLEFRNLCGKDMVAN